jgi:pimeloyl-ACP methyl ester carboxylesterase
LWIDVTALINAASAKKVVLIGHDWGAMVAWCFAAQQRRPLHRLMIMNDPHPLCFRSALKALATDAQILVRSVFSAADTARTDAKPRRVTVLG